eukprot:COSAG02_NODE_68244_length_251_cov_0.664474_1_plen_83_part_11
MVVQDDSSTLHRLIFTDNRATRGGGVFASHGSNTVLRDGIFSYNHAERGGAIFSDSSACKHASNELMHNSASVHGGGVMIYNS